MKGNNKRLAMPLVECGQQAYYADALTKPELGCKLLKFDNDGDILREAVRFSWVCHSGHTCSISKGIKCALSLLEACRWNCRRPDSLCLGLRTGSMLPCL